MASILDRFKQKEESAQAAVERERLERYKKLELVPTGERRHTFYYGGVPFLHWRDLTAALEVLEFMQGYLKHRAGTIRHIASNTLSLEDFERGVLQRLADAMDMANNKLFVRSELRDSVETFGRFKVGQTWISDINVIKILKLNREHAKVARYTLLKETLIPFNADTVPLLYIEKFFVPLNKEYVVQAGDEKPLPLLNGIM